MYWQPIQYFDTNLNEFKYNSHILQKMSWQNIFIESSSRLLLTQFFFNIGITHVARKQRLAQFLLVDCYMLKYKIHYSTASAKKIDMIGHIYSLVE